MRNKLCQVDFITFWNDGVISVDDGVGFVGELCTMEALELYQELRKFFEEEKVSTHSKQSTPCKHKNTVGVVAYYKCSDCGFIIEPERD